jgi:hypothetical protein
MIEQLGEYKHINGVNSDIFKQLFLKNTEKKIIESKLTEYVNVSDQFDKERQNSNKYFIYGGIEFFSLLNGITTNYEYFEDFFKKVNNDNKNIFNSFDFYLVKPINNLDETLNYDNITGNTFLRKFEVIAKNTDFIINKQGYSKNIFGDIKYYYLINKDINLEYKYDWFGKPITELYIMPIYKKNYIGTIDNDEKVYISDYVVDDYSIEVIYNEIMLTGDTMSFNIGDIIDGDVVYWNLNNYSETKLYDKTIKIETFYDNSGTTESITWKYDLFIPIKIDYLENEINVENVSGRTYVEFPEQAIKLDDQGNYIWRNLIDKGFVDNLYGIGTNFPFINGKHYLYNNNILKLIPDISDTNTYNKFKPVMKEYITEDNNIDTSNYGDLC